MAIVHTATVLATRPIGIDGRHLTLALAPGAELGSDVLGFVGGQYVIVDSGLTLPNGRAAKRAYFGNHRIRGRLRLLEHFELEVHDLAADDVAKVVFPKLAVPREPVHQKFEAQPSPES